MGRLSFIWDLHDDPDGNYWHICVEGHGVSREEVEEVLDMHHPGDATSRSSGKPLVFGWTSTGKYIVVAYEDVPEDDSTVYPLTAYEVLPPKSGKKRRKK